MLPVPLKGRYSPGSRLAVLLLFGHCVWSAAIVEAAVPNVESSGRDEVRFSLVLPEPDWRPAPAADPTFEAWDAVLPGFVSSGTPGQARVPRAGGWLLVPPGTTPRLEVIREEWVPLDGRPLVIVPVPVMVEDPHLDGWSERPVLPRPDQSLPLESIPVTVRQDMQRLDPALTADAGVMLGETTWWRGRRIVPYTLLPIRVEGSDQAAAALRRGEWRVRFVAGPEAGKRIPEASQRRLSGQGDDRFGGFFLNGDLLASLPTEAGRRGPGPAKLQAPRVGGASLGYPEVRIPVRRTQLHRVRASELVAAGLLPSSEIQASQLRLYQRRYLPELDDPSIDEVPPYLEIEVPIHVVGEGELFGPDDLFLFWGLRLRDDRAFTHEHDGIVYSLPSVRDTLEIDNENNIYWLQLADPPPGESWARMPVQAMIPASQGSPAESYRRTDIYNEALAYRENIPHIGQERYYYNTQLDVDARVNLSFWSPVPGQTGAQITMGIANFGNAQRTVQLDLVRDETQVAALPNVTLTDRYVRPFSAPLPAAVLTGESLFLRMRNSNPALRVASFLDWVEVSYDALYSAPTGRLLFPGGDGVMAGNLEIGGFTTEDVGLVEVTDPRQPVWVGLTRQNLVGDGDGSYTLSLHVDQSEGPRRFYAAARMTSNGVVDIRYDEASLAADFLVPTRRQEERADVLVVVHPEFMAATEAWIEYRRSRAGPGGLTFQVVRPQDLFDWYTGGLKDPWAIKRLVNHALDSPTWSSYALVLVGTANENPREIGVVSNGRQWSRDWVPTHFHVQADVGEAPEVLASDKWFVSQMADDVGFPGSVFQPTDMYVGRFPVNNAAEVARILTKIQQTEAVGPGQDWRRRGVFMADDAYSSDSYSIGGGFTLRYVVSELAFETSQVGVLAETWANNGGQVDLTADSVLLREFMEPVYPPPGGEIELTLARQWCVESGAPDALIAALSRGATLAHFQGHANHWLLTHEVWFKHDVWDGLRTDVDQLTNEGKPFLFCGMGCHLGDFIQNVAFPNRVVEPGLGEKLLLWTDGGAVAVYASSGYEFLHSNRDLSQVFIDRMMNRPPHVTVRGEVVTSRWRLGELMWAAEADMLAINSGSTYRKMVYQYLVLGDPLLRLDAGLPEVEAVLTGSGGGALPDLQADLVAVDASGRRTVQLQARDEAGIDRLRLLDSAGAEVVGAVVTETPQHGGGNRQIIDFELDLPVNPYPHDVLVRIHDSGAPLDGDPHVELVLHVAHEVAAAKAQGGEPLDPQQFIFTPGEPVSLVLTVTSAAWLSEATTVTATGRNLDLSAVSHVLVDNHELQVSLTATAPEQKTRLERGVDLVLDGFTTYVPLEANDTIGPVQGISRLVSYPNPMREETRFVFATSVEGGRGKVRVWTVSGREVAVVPFTLDGVGQEVVRWNGRDRVGDRLANGTYLYRVEVEGSQGQVRSGMQRLVIMR